MFWKRVFIKNVFILGLEYHAKSMFKQMKSGIILKMLSYKRVLFENAVIL